VAIARYEDISTSSFRAETFRNIFSVVNIIIIMANVEIEGAAWSLGRVRLLVQVAANNIHDVFIRLLRDLRARDEQNQGRGLCRCCGVVQTHEIVGFPRRRRVPLKNWMVYHGTCLRCASMGPVILILGFAMMWKYLFTETPMVWWKKMLEYWIQIRS